MFSSNGSTTERILGLEATKKEQGGGTAVSRKGRSEARTNKREVTTANTLNFVYILDTISSHFFRIFVT